MSDNAYWLLRVNVQYLLSHSATTAWRDQFPGWAAGELAALKSGGTVVDWMRAHPRDSLSTFAPRVFGSSEDWCARATIELPLTDSSRVVRRAYFYPPPITDRSVLPSPATPEAIARACILGTVVASLGVPTPADGLRLVATTAKALTATIGGSPQPWPPGSEVPLLGGSGWNVGGPWLADSMTILTAARTRFFLLDGPSVAALAYKPLSGFGKEPQRTFTQGYQLDSAFVAEAAALTGLESPKVEPLFSLLAQAESARAGLTHPDHAPLVAAVVSTVWHWLEYARPLDPPRRAGAYLAADRLLGNDAFDLLLSSPADSVGRRPLERWGAEFGSACCEPELHYAHSWLAEAVRLDPKSGAGNLAFLAQLGGCEPGPVIEQGEAFMENLSDPVLRAHLHFALGDAYADSVGMAGQVDVGETYRTNVRDAPTARSKAIEHFRAGLAIDRTSPVARAALFKAWRLLAGLPPLSLRFHCEAD